MTETEFIAVGNEISRNSRDRRILDFVSYANQLMIAVKELSRPARTQPKGLKTADRNAYMREYMRKRRQKEKKA